MVIATAAVYVRPGMVTGAEALFGSDYEMLHRWRMEFARQSYSVPGWNPHFAMGAPFAANLQSFPWIPTRLVLLLFDPAIAFGVGVLIAALLSAWFMYLFGRRCGLSGIAAAVAGWTFACAGYFSSRVMAGHLPLLEAYPALPMLLWMIERCGERRRDLLVLALGTACVVVAGHPQVPAYAIAVALAYIWVCGRHRLRATAAIVFGAGLTLAVWWPMLLLIGRSTRVLHLAAPDNDIAMPYSRLLALIVPGIHGWAGPVGLSETNPFAGFPNNAYFWDTASYMGVLPWLAVAVLLASRRVPDRRSRFLAWAGAIAFVCSLPVAAPLLHALPGTFLRSPARLFYIVTFCVAVAVGFAVDALRRANKALLMAALVVAHVVDLAWFDRRFIETFPRDDKTPFEAELRADPPASFRIAEQREDDIFPYEKTYDDAGGFDSIFLPGYDRLFMNYAGRPPDTNEQVFDASTLPPAALASMSVKYVITEDERSDLDLVATEGDAYLYRVKDPSPRATWVGEQTAMQYTRPSPDEIEIAVDARAPGHVRVNESYDPGWSASIDGSSAPVVEADGYAISVAVPSGSHIIQLAYSTPGRMTGIALSAASLVLLALCLRYSGRDREE